MRQLSRAVPRWVRGGACAAQACQARCQAHGCQTDLDMSVLIFRYQTRLRIAVVQMEKEAAKIARSMGSMLNHRALQLYTTILSYRLQ